MNEAKMKKNCDTQGMVEDSKSLLQGNLNNRH